MGMTNSKMGLLMYNSKTGIRSLLNSRMRTINSELLILLSLGVGVGALYWYFFGRKAVSKVLRYWYPSEGQMPIRGLKNLGATCYFNAVLQAMAACSHVTTWMAHRDDQNKFDFPPCLHTPKIYAGLAYPVLAVVYRAILVINRVIGQDESDYRLARKVPVDIIRTLELLDYSFITYDEQDTFECFQHILNALGHEGRRSVLRRHRGSVDVLVDDPTCNSPTREEADMFCNEISFSHYQDYLAFCGMRDGSGDKRRFKRRYDGDRIDVDHEEKSDFKDKWSLYGWSTEVQARHSDKGVMTRRRPLFVPTPNVVPDPKFPFQGMTCTLLQCISCLQKLPIQFETFESLTLLLPKYVNPAENKLNIKSLIRELQKPVLVHDVNCAGCSKIHGKPTKSAFSKSLYFARLPSVLVFHVHQSEWRGGLNGLVKRSETVKFEEFIDVDILHHWSHVLDKDWDATTMHSISQIPFWEREAKNQELWNFYELKAVIAHSGDAYEGHFSTFRRLPPAPGGGGAKRWAFVSDDNIIEVSDVEPFWFKPYLLFYEKASLDSLPPHKRMKNYLNSDIDILKTTLSLPPLPK